MTTSPFNSKYGFDLGEISNIEFSGVSSTSDQVLIVKPDATGKFYLYPQDINSVGGSSITYAATGSSYLKKQVFTNSMTASPSSYKTIQTFNFDIGTKTKLYLTTKIDLIGQGTDGPTYNYYHFTSGYNVISDVNGDASEYYYRHIPGHISHIFNKTASTDLSTQVAIGPDKQFQNFTALPSNNTVILQPKFSTITNPLDINAYPKIVSSINSSTQGSKDDKLVLTIQAKSIKSTSENIEWFGSVEFFASII
jgi:hypothetical protein